MGKGSKQRKRQISREDYSNNWDRIFKKQEDRGSDKCDDCNGCGSYLIDNEPQKCICSECQHNEDESCCETCPSKD